MPFGAEIQLHLPPIQELARTPISNIKATGLERRQAPLKARHRVIKDRLAIHGATRGEF